MLPGRPHPTNPLALAVLALLSERPMHPYEIGVILKERHKEDSIKLRYGSLYTVIDFLLKRGLITAHETSRDGRRPERTVYEITPAGGDELDAWMTDLLGEPVKEYPRFEAALCLLPVLPPQRAQALLRRRLQLIERNVSVLAQRIREVGSRGLPPLFLVETEYRLAMMKAEQQFVAGLLRQIDGGWGPVELWRAIHEDREATLEKLYREFGGAPMS